MAEYYRAIFTVKDENIIGLDLLEKVIAEVRQWARYEFDQPLNGERGDLDGPNGRLRFGTRPLEKYGVSWLVWERSDDGGAELQWRLSVRLATEGDDVEADIEVQGLDTGREELRAKPPDIISILFTNLCCILDGKRLSATARKISTEQASSFREELLNPSRSMPLLVVSEDAMDADSLQRQLLGIVNVISYDRDTAWEISKNLPRAIRCYDGAIRLYSPNCLESDVSQQHPYWLPGDVEQLGRERMYRILRDECVNRLPRHGRRRIFSRVRDTIRRQETEELETKLKQQAMDDETFLALLEMTEDEDADSVPLSRFNVLMKQAKALKNKCDRLETEIKILKDSSDSAQSPESSLPAPNSQDTQPSAPVSDSPEPEFANILEVMNWADSELEGLHFFQSAFESAEPVAKSGQFKRTDRLYHVFNVMNECALERRGGSIGRLTRWFEDRQVTYARGESKSTNEEFPDTRIYEGLRMEEHFKLRDDKGGKFELRIHVHWDEEENQWIIGHVGGHEPTSSDPH